MSAISTQALTYRYGRTLALENLKLDVPEGVVYALLGPNGSGKTTLLQILAGLRRLVLGEATVLGMPVQRVTPKDRQRIGYIAEGQSLPGWMTLRQLEAFLAPLYTGWDHALAAALRERFALDPARKLKTLSRGQRMQVSLLCALAPRPQLLLMDEPFTGMDAVVKDELVRGLLETAGGEGWTVVLCSHDIAEVEMLAEWVGYLRQGRLTMSEPLEQIRARFRRVEIVSAAPVEGLLPSGTLRVQRAGHRLSGVVTSDEALEHVRRGIATMPPETRLEVHDLSLREVFLAMSEAPLPASGPTRLPR